MQPYRYMVVFPNVSGASAEFSALLRRAMVFVAGTTPEQQELYDYGESLRVSDVGSEDEYAKALLYELKRDCELIRDEYVELQSGTPPEGLAPLHTVVLKLLRCTWACMHHFDGVIETGIKDWSGSREAHEQGFRTWAAMATAAQFEYLDVLAGIAEKTNSNLSRVAWRTCGSACGLGIVMLSRRSSSTK